MDTSTDEYMKFDYSIQVVRGKYSYLGRLKCRNSERLKHGTNRLFTSLGLVFHDMEVAQGLGNMIWVSQSRCFAWLLLPSMLSMFNGSTKPLSLVLSRAGSVFWGGHRCSAVSIMYWGMEYCTIETRDSCFEFIRFSSGSNSVRLYLNSQALQYCFKVLHMLGVKTYHILRQWR